MIKPFKNRLCSFLGFLRLGLNFGTNKGHRPMDRKDGGMGSNVPPTGAVAPGGNIENYVERDSMGSVDVSLDQLKTEVAMWRNKAEALWQILDDIDTISDMVKYDDAVYRKLVEKSHKKRFAHLISDGYDLFLPDHVFPTRELQTPKECEG